MKNTNRLFSKAIASVMLAWLCLCLITSVSRAQCPSDITPTSTDPNYSPWTGPFTTTMTITGTSCTVSVTFCIRTLLDGTDQTAIEQIKPTSSNCDDLLWIDIMNDVREQFFQGVSTSPCGHGSVITVATVLMASCSELEISPYYVCKFCPGAWCAKTCQLCNVNGVNQELNCTYTQIGTADCANAPAGWPNLSVSATLVSATSYPSTWVDHCFLTQACSE